jgi:hypothetical protein
MKIRESLISLFNAITKLIGGCQYGPTMHSASLSF